MTDDPVSRVFFFVSILVALFVALRPDLFVKFGSYGRRDIRNLSSAYVRGVRIVQIIAGLSALVGAAELAWWLAHSGAH